MSAEKQKPEPRPGPSWDETLEDLAQRRAAARAMGGPERLEKRMAPGRLDARERVEHLLDPGSFQEFGTLVGGDVPADGIVAGSGTINGRPVMVGSEDFTTLAGTIGGGSNAKRYRAAELALRDRMPFVMLLEGAGARTGGHGGRSPTDLIVQSQCSGRVPVVSAVMGASAGHGALIVPMSDFSVMTADAAVFTAGPPVVKESLGEEISKQDLGGPRVAIPSGLIHNLAPDDPSALQLIRDYLSYFPSSAWSYPPSRGAAERGDQGPRRTDELLDIVPRDSRKVYDMRRVIDVIVDDASGSRSSPDSAARSSAGSRTWAANRSPSSPINRASSRVRSTRTPPTRPRTSSWWRTRSMCRSCSSPTTRACSRGGHRSARPSSAAAPGCSRPRHRRPP